MRAIDMFHECSRNERAGRCVQHRSGPNQSEPMMEVRMADSRICSIPGCDKSAAARGWCKTHYYRWKRNGDPLAGRVPPGALIQWLEANLSFPGDECLTWPFGKNSWGYGVVTFDGKRIAASRAMCILAHGSPPSDDDEAAHSCGRGHEGCVNPKHIRWASRPENYHDRNTHGTSNRGQRNGVAKLTEADALAIRDMYRLAPQSDVAERFGISACQVSKIQSGQSWGWLRDDRC
jgi:hypothetical protein